MSVIYSDEDWVIKLSEWKKDRRSSFFPIIRKFLSKIRRSETRRILCKILGFFYAVNCLVKRVNSSDYMLPNLKLFNNYDIDDFSHASTSISIYDFISSVVNITASFIQNPGGMYGITNDIHSFLIESRDFIFSNGRYTTRNIYYEALSVEINSENDVLVCGLDLIDCPDVILYTALYQVLFVQQYISHWVYGHLVCVYGYNFLKSNDISGNCVIDIIMDFGKDNRNFTEGYGKMNALSENFDNFFIADDDEIEEMTDYINCIDYMEILSSDWENDYLVLGTSKNVYRAHKTFVIDKVSNFELNRLERTLGKTSIECVYFLTNMIYALGYHHNKSHYMLSYISMFLVHNDNFDNMVRQIQHSHISNSHVNELQNRVNLVKQGEGSFIFNSHT